MRQRLSIGEDALSFWSARMPIFPKAVGRLPCAGGAIGVIGIRWISDVSVKRAGRIETVPAAPELAGYALGRVIRCSRRVVEGPSFPNSDAASLCARGGDEITRECRRVRVSLPPSEPWAGWGGRARWSSRQAGAAEGETRVSLPDLAFGAGWASEQDLDRWKEIF